MVCVLEVCLAFEVGRVLKGAGSEIVHAHYAVAFDEEPLAEVTPQESRPSRNQRPFVCHRKST